MGHMRFHHHTTPNGVPPETYKLFISGIFHLIFLDRVGCGLLKPWEAKPQMRKNYCAAGSWAVNVSVPKGRF